MIIAKILFALMIGWHFSGHFISLVYGGAWGDFPVKPPWAWLLGTTSFHDPIQYNLFWSAYVAVTALVGVVAMIPRE